MPTDNPYISRFDNWDERATVRVKPRRTLQLEEEQGKVFFPPELVAMVEHPLVQARGPAARREVLIRHLYTYLDFTTFLEHDLINGAARRIATGGTDFELPEKVLFDAYKLYCDEAYHALFSEDLKRQIQEATGVRQARPAIPTFLRWCRQQQQQHDPRLHGLLEVFFATIVETLISATLVQVPRHPQVVQPVRDLIADHAEDEAFHFQYFSYLFGRIWIALDKSHRQLIGPLLPEFIIRFLSPDETYLERNLGSIGLSDEEIHTVTAESYPRAELLEGIKRTARNPLRLFEEFDVRSDPRTADAFAATGLAP
jgi:P-aminobenzoate N-oxygenase AurF